MDNWIRCFILMITIQFLQVAVCESFLDEEITTLAQYAAPALTPEGRVDIPMILNWTTATNANTYNYLLEDSTGNNYLDFVQMLDQTVGYKVKGEQLRLWVTLIPPTESKNDKCSIVADSPLTPFNETSFFDQSLGYKGCNDYAAWAKTLGLLAGMYPHFVAVNVDDFSPYNIPQRPDIRKGGIFTNELLDEMLKLMKVKVNLRFLPTMYYSTLSKHYPGFVLDYYTDLPNHVDGFLFYFRNEKQGMGPCKNTSCGVPFPDKCWYGCLAGECSEKTVQNIVGEIEDVYDKLSKFENKELHVGFYAQRHSTCGTPSHEYVYEILETVLSEPSISRVDGITVYRMQHITTDCSDVMSDEGCIVREVFGEHWK